MNIQRLILPSDTPFSMFKTKTVIKAISMASIILFTFSSCGDKDQPGGGGFNLFTLEDDISFGAQVSEEIESDPMNYPILDSAQNTAAYGHIYRIRDSVLQSGNVVHVDDFVWQVRIVENDSVLNAFCTPGGYIYVYTGLIKFLDAENELAGVMAHEIAHADERHSTEALTKAYGIDVLFSVLLGDQSVISQVAQGLLNLRYSRQNESESDRRSVEYLYPTAYDARGAAKFFEKLLSAGSSNPPEFLSTHPDPSNRVEDINELWESLGGKVGETYPTRYQEFINSLP